MSLLAIGDRRERRSVSHSHRHRTMLATYGFGLFSPPRLRDARVGGWRLVRYLPSLGEGYGSGAVVESWVCCCRGRLAWMSSGLMELESHSWHVHQARGLVVAAGLGLRTLRSRVLRQERGRPGRDPRARAGSLALVHQSARIAEWPGAGKLTITVADALSPQVAETVARAVGRRRPDYFYADIWSACAAPDAPAETATMVAALRPRAAGWWGQELSFGLWCRERGYEPDASALGNTARRSACRSRSPRATCASAATLSRHGFPASGRATGGGAALALAPAARRRDATAFSLIRASAAVVFQLRGRVYRAKSNPLQAKSIFREDDP